MPVLADIHIHGTVWSVLFLLAIIVTGIALGELLLWLDYGRHERRKQRDKGVMMSFEPGSLRDPDNRGVQPGKRERD